MHNTNIVLSLIVRAVELFIIGAVITLMTGRVEVFGSQARGRC